MSQLDKKFKLSDAVFEHALYYFLLRNDDFHESYINIKRKKFDIYQKDLIAKISVYGNIYGDEYDNALHKGTYYIDARNYEDDIITIYHNKKQNRRVRLKDIKQSRRIPFYKKNKNYKKHSFDYILNSNEFECVYVGNLTNLM